MAKTRYVVLEEMALDDTIGGVEDCWQVYSTDIYATSAAGAIRAALNGQGSLHSRYVAVPVRSWQPQPVEVETQHRLKIG